MNDLEIPPSPNLNTQLANAVASVARAQDHLISMERQTAEARREASPGAQGSASTDN